MSEVKHEHSYTRRLEHTSPSAPGECERQTKACSTWKEALTTGQEMQSTAHETQHLSDWHRSKHGRGGHPVEDGVCHPEAWHVGSTPAPQPLPGTSIRLLQKSRGRAQPTCHRSTGHLMLSR